MLQGGLWWGIYCESSRTFGERFKEHQKAPSPIYEHFNTTGHNVTIDNFIILGREDQNLRRAIKEALYIRVNNPSLNRNIGKYYLPHIWDEILLNTSELKLKSPWPYGCSICHLVIISTNWYLKPPCSDHSICHLAITSAKNNMLQHAVMWFNIFHTPNGNNICHL